MVDRIPANGNVYSPVPGRTLTRRSRSILVALAALAALVGSATAAFSADAPPLVLGNDHVGMTAESLGATDAPPAPSPAPAPAATPAPEGPASDQAHADALRAEADAAHERARVAAERAEAARMALEAAEAGQIPGIGSNTDGPASYATCIEASIRRGLAYAESDRLCRAVFEGSDG